jgi:hypothetical protein
MDELDPTIGTSTGRQRIQDRAVKDECTEHAPAVRQRSREGCIVLQPQVAAQPDQGRRQNA